MTLITTSAARPSDRPLVVIQRNPRSGSGRSKGELRKLARRLKEHGFHVRMFSDRERLDDVVRTAETPPVAIVAAGGDGTVCDVFNRHQNLPIATLPLGTENLLAKYLRIPKDGAALADVIAAGQQKRFDTGTLNGTRFLLMAGFGVDAAVVKTLDESRAGTISHLSYLQPITRTFRKYDYVPVRAYLDGNPEPLVGCQIMVVNLPVYALQMPFAANADGTDGLFEVRVFEKGSAFQMLKYLYKVRRRQHEQMPDVHCASARSVRIEADTVVPAQVDGDPAGTTPAQIEMVPSSVVFVVP